MPWFKIWPNSFCVLYFDWFISPILVLRCHNQCVTIVINYDHIPKQQINTGNLSFYIKQGLRHNNKIKLDNREASLAAPVLRGRRHTTMFAPNTRPNSPAPRRAHQLCTLLGTCLDIIQPSPLPFTPTSPTLYQTTIFYTAPIVSASINICFYTYCRYKIPNNTSITVIYK